MTSFLLYLLGGILLVAGIALLFFGSGLEAMVPPGMVLAGFLILVGLVVIGLSSRAPRGPKAERERTGGRSADR